MRRMTYVCVLSLLAIAVATPAMAEVKVAVIDVERVVRESDPGKEAFAKLRRLQEAKLEEGRAMQQELVALRDQLQKQRTVLAEAKLEEMRKEIENKTIALKRFEDDAQREFDEASRKELGALEQRIMPIIDTLGKDEGLTLIFNKFQSGLVFADESVDITSDVIRRFNTAQ